jgi:hypothetical protein
VLALYNSEAEACRQYEVLQAARPTGQAGVDEWYVLFSSSKEQDNHPYIAGRSLSLGSTTPSTAIMMFIWLSKYKVAPACL